MPKDLPLVQMDFRLMEHALANLLLNAAAYSPHGTSIRIWAKKVDSTLCLAVEDQGPGIPENLLDKVFEKFFRVPGTPTGGVGLGLSIVKNIVEFHKGRVGVENRPQGGARFTIELPLKEPPSVPKEDS
jgi:two-component system sensor histidine kinase KdpD